MLGSVLGKTQHGVYLLLRGYSVCVAFLHTVVLHSLLYQDLVTRQARAGQGEPAVLSPVGAVGVEADNSVTVGCARCLGLTGVGTAQSFASQS
jgi:hypothetical protein